MDKLGWVINYFVLAVCLSGLILLGKSIDRLAVNQDSAWQMAAKERADIREDVADLKGRLTVTPVEVLKQVQEIKGMLETRDDWHKAQHAAPALPVKAKR